MSTATTSGITHYYDFAKLFSYNATINAVCGGRGMGKTWGSKRKSINDALRSTMFETVRKTVKRRGQEKKIEVLESSKIPDQFIYLRRYKEEMAIAKETFFADIEHLWPTWEFRVNGWKAQASPLKYKDNQNRPWATIGFFISLSVSQSFKSAQFPNVKTLIFDEFIIEKGGQYLPSEATKFINFISTVSRYRPNLRVLMLANAVTITNPYFIHYNVDLRTVDENNFIFMVKLPAGRHYLLWHFPDSAEFRAEVDATDFGYFIKQTDPEYHDYAVGNIFHDNHEALIATKPSTADYIFTIEAPGGIFSIWYDGPQNVFYAQKKRPAGNEDFRTFIPEKMAEGKTLATFQDKTMGMLRTAYRHDRMRFDYPATRNAFMELFKR